MSEPLVVVVHVEDTANQHQRAAVEDAFAAVGFDVTVRADDPRGSADLLPWVVMAALGVPVTAFFTAIGSQAGADTYGAVKAWFKRLIDDRVRSGAGEEGSIVLIGPQGSRLVVASDHPDAALDALATVDRELLDNGYVVWDASRGWYEEMPR